MGRLRVPNFASSCVHRPSWSHVLVLGPIDTNAHFLEPPRYSHLVQLSNNL